MEATNHEPVDLQSSEHAQASMGNPPAQQVAGVVVSDAHADLRMVEEGSSNTATMRQGCPAMNYEPDYNATIPRLSQLSYGLSIQGSQQMPKGRGKDMHLFSSLHCKFLSISKIFSIEPAAQKALRLTFRRQASPPPIPQVVASEIRTRTKAAPINPNECSRTRAGAGRVHRWQDAEEMRRLSTQNEV